MGESACLMQPFSYTAPERDSVSGLGQSVSFGRFMSEKLEWEKWSAFTTQNRYVAEAERYSKPGSVAQKKAFFEAHYKKLAAARKAAAEEEALLLQQQQQQNPNNKPVTEESEKKAPVQEDGFVISKKPDQEDGFVVLKPDLETPKGFSEPQMKLLAEKVTKFGNRKVNDEKENVGSEQTEKKTPMILTKKAKDSQPMSSTKPRVTKCDSTQKTPSQKPRNKRNSYTFTPAKEFNRLVSIIKKIDGSTRASSSSSKPSKDCKTPLRTPSNKVSAKGIIDDSLYTPLSSNRRGKLGHDSSAKTGRGGRWSFLSTEKSRTPSCFTPFALRTEERAERRKKKLEEKFKDMEPQETVVEEEKSVEKEESKLQQRLCFKAKPLPNFYKRRPKSTDQTKKALLY